MLFSIYSFSFDHCTMVHTDIVPKPTFVFLHCFQSYLLSQFQDFIELKNMIFLYKCSLFQNFNIKKIDQTTEIFLSVISMWVPRTWVPRTCRGKTSELQTDVKKEMSSSWNLKPPPKRLYSTCTHK